MDQATRGYQDLAYLFGGAFLANALPHLVNGISGSPFQRPFASPPGAGLSSSTVNVLWAWCPESSLAKKTILRSASNRG